MPIMIATRKNKDNRPSIIVTKERLVFVYLVFLKESEIVLILNFGVLINADFFPRYPCKTAKELWKESPILSDKNAGNRKINLNIALSLLFSSHAFRTFAT